MPAEAVAAPEIQITSTTGEIKPAILSPINQSEPVPNGFSTTAKEMQQHIQRGEKSVLETPEGTLYVSRPFRSSQSKKLKAMISFVPRESAFDLSNASSGSDQFRGFFTLFWVSMFILAVRTYVISFEETGSPLALGFASMLSRDGRMLALSDAIMVGNTFLCVPLAKAFHHGWIPYYSLGVTIQHIYQATILGVAVAWGYNRDWPWVQSGFLVLHSLVMIMKVHSYLTTNGQLSLISRLSVATERHLRQATARVGGWDQAIRDAEAANAASHLTTGSSRDSTPIGTPTASDDMPQNAQTSYVEGVTPAALRKRLMDAASAVPEAAKEKARDAKELDLVDDVHKPKGHPLMDHPDAEIAALARDLHDMEGELCSSGKEKVRYPANVTVWNYWEYLLIPSLVYDIEFPRTDRIRPLYVLEKTVATFGTFTLLYTITAHAILPYTPTRDQSFLRSLLDLSLPFMLSYLLLFYLMFDCICNGFAELSRFADRQFYEDWWNSTSWDEFARKWNKPVHHFLLRHVYASTVSARKVSRGWATFLTFLLSAAVHELVMVVVTKKFRMYLFMMQMVQLPLITIGRLPAVKKQRILGNVVFWIGLYAGFPLLCVAYCAY